MQFPGRIILVLIYYYTYSSGYSTTTKKAKSNKKLIGTAKHKLTETNKPSDDYNALKAANKMAKSYMPTFGTA